MGKRLEKIVYNLGRLRGLYNVALKGPATLTDPTAWNTGQYWGPGSVAMQDKPGDRADIAKWFMSWAYICATTNANARAAVPTGLFVASSMKGTPWTLIKTRGIEKPRLKHIKSRQDLRKYVIKAEELEEVTSHRYLDLMARPNPWISESDLKYLTSLFMDLSGAAYWYIGVRDGLGVPAQIWPIPSQYITPIPGTSLDEFVKGYEYKRGRIRQVLSVDDVVEFKVPSPINEYIGMSCLRGISDAVYVNAKMYEFEEALFINKARVGGVLETETTVTPAQSDRLREDFRTKYEGAAQAGRTVILPKGMKFSPDSMTPEELSYMEGKRITADEICAGFGAPRALFDPNAIKSNVEAAQYTHAYYTVEPWCRRYDDTLNGDFMPEYDDTKRLFVASENSVPEDRVFLLSKRTADLNSGVSTINEERAEDGKEPVEGGDVPLVSQMLVPLSQVIAEPEPIEPLDDPDDENPVPPVNPDEDEDADNEGDLDTGKLAGIVLAKIREKLEGE
jgi:HK97 family phage portal protein